MMEKALLFAKPSNWAKLSHTHTNVQWIYVCQQFAPGTISRRKEESKTLDPMHPHASLKEYNNAESSKKISQSIADVGDPRHKLLHVRQSSEKSRFLRC